MNKGYIFKNEEIKALKAFLSLFFYYIFSYMILPMNLSYR